MPAAWEVATLGHLLRVHQLLVEIDAEASPFRPLVGMVACHHRVDNAGKPGKVLGRMAEDRDTRWRSSGSARNRWPEIPAAVLFAHPVHPLQRGAQGRRLGLLDSTCL